MPTRRKSSWRRASWPLKPRRRHRGLQSGLVPDDVIEKSHDHLRQHLPGMTIPGSIDPSLKDHFAALIYENHG